MPKKIIFKETIHKVPKDLKLVLGSKSEVFKKWETLTSLAQNEWICWVTIVKKAETRKDHIERLCTDILAGKRRPCCWPGCPHRRESAKKYFS